MNSKKGFTLIELLAVIVILAIIALIATPIVLNIINDSKKESDKRSIELYGEAVEQAIAKAQLTSTEQPLGQYTSTDGKTLTNGSSTIKVDYKGNKVVCDVIISQKGTVSLYNCKVDDKEVEYTYGEKIYKNGEVVYFDVDTGEVCSDKEYHEDNSKTGYNGITKSTTNQTGCLKFYAFNDDGGDKLNLILDHNTTAAIAWNETTSETIISDEDGIHEVYGEPVNTDGPDEAFLNQLKEDTKSWNGTITPKKYTNQKYNYTIDYSGYKARIITAQEIAQITGNTSFNETTSTTSFYFDTNTSTSSETCKSGNTTGCKYGWLYDRTYICETYGCEHSDSLMDGYWTATPCVVDSSCARYVEFDGFLGQAPVGYSNISGIRPVITVSKSKLQ